jgi:hypothetical protein
LQHSLIIKAGFVSGQKAMSLPGHDHVVIAEEPDFDRATSCMGKKRTPACDMISLGLFSAKGSAYPANFHNDILLLYAKDLGNQCLRL